MAINSEFSKKLWFSIAMLNYQRVLVGGYQLPSGDVNSSLLNMAKWPSRNSYDLPINSMVIFQLMSWLVVWNMAFIFHYFPIGNVIIPTDFHVFQMGRSPPTSLWWDKYWFIHQAEISVVNQLSKLGGFPSPYTDNRSGIAVEGTAQDAPEIRYWSFANAVVANLWDSQMFEHCIK